MPHVTFVHGIMNMPPKERLLEIWEAALTRGGLDLACQGVTTSMVYWADVMYAEPQSVSAAFESVGEGMGTQVSDEDMAWIRNLPADERAFVEAFAGKLDFDRASPGDDFYAPPAVDAESGALTFEAIPLPWFIKRRAMKALLKDVYYYLFNGRFSPRPGEDYQVRDHIRNLFVDQLKADAANKGPHVVVAHSMGTVISYDCLKNVPGCPLISGYLTLGSPLGLSEVQDRFEPAYRRWDAYPSSTLADDWINMNDRLDPVAFDSRIRHEYQRQGQDLVRDERVVNNGVNRHSVVEYLAQPALCKHLGALLGL